MSDASTWGRGTVCNGIMTGGPGLRTKLLIRSITWDASSFSGTPVLPQGPPTTSDSVPVHASYFCDLGKK